MPLLAMPGHDQSRMLSLCLMARPQSRMLSLCLMAQPQSRMLSLCLGGMIIPSQIPTKFTPTRPESNMKIINMKRKFHVHHADFRQVPCLVSKNGFKK